MKMTALAFSLFAASVAFGGVLDNAWIKGTTDKDPITYKPGERMTFTLAAQGLDGELPEGEYFLQWTRSGDDGIRENGKEPLTTAPYV